MRVIDVEDVLLDVLARTRRAIEAHQHWYPQLEIVLHPDVKHELDSCLEHLESINDLIERQFDSPEELERALAERAVREREIISK